MSSFQNQKSLIVDDVDAFPGHIRCDANRRSEMVIPIFVGGKVRGVLDLDSPRLGRFQNEDLQMIESAISHLSKKLESFHEVSFGNLEITASFK